MDRPQMSATGSLPPALNGPPRPERPDSGQPYLGAEIISASLGLK